MIARGARDDVAAAIAARRRAEPAHPDFEDLFISSIREAA